MSLLKKVWHRLTSIRAVGSRDDLLETPALASPPVSSRTTQFKGRRGNETCDVVVGFDFGTSCTKVVLRTPYHSGGQAYAVAFGDAAHASSQYLLPSVLWVSKDGSASLTPVNGGLFLRDIKYHLMRGKSVPAVNGDDNNKPFDPKIVAVAFLAIALRKAREWFLREQRQLYGDYTLRWAFNIGLPSADFANEDLCATYHRIAEAAWWISLTHSTITLDAAKDALQSPDAWNSIDEELAAEVHEIPEVAAEVVGYARSHLQEEGLHILIDIGASTLDVCGFILHEIEGDDRYELLTADVRGLGVMALYDRRVSGVRRAVEVHESEQRDNSDPVSPIPDELTTYLPCHDAIARSLHEHDQEYRRLWFQAMWQTIVKLRTTRDPNSPRWHDEMPVFVAGGGSLMPFYQDAIEELSGQLHEFYHECRGIRALSLAKPDDLVADVAEQDYHRLAVAWGLSYPETDIGKVTRPSEIEDIQPPRTHDWQSNAITKDMV